MESPLLSQSGHNLKEEQLGAWEEANLMGIPLTASFSKMRGVISSGLSNVESHPAFPFFSLIFDMGDHLGLPWKTIATSLGLLWRYAKVQNQKRNLQPPSSPPSPDLPSPPLITPIQEFNTFFRSLSPKEIHILSYACLLLASKAEETLFSLRVLNEIHDDYFVIRGETSPLTKNDKNSPPKRRPSLWRLHEKDRSFDRDWLTRKVKEQEVALLRDLGFSLNVHHLTFLRLLQIMNALSIPQNLQEQTICLANFCLFSPLVLLDRPCLLAVSLLYLVATFNNETITIPPTSLQSSAPPACWWSMFNVSSSNIQTIAQQILSLLESVQMKQTLLGNDIGELPVPSNKKDLLHVRSNAGFGVSSSLVDLDGPIVEQSFLSCRDISEFVKEKKISEGTYGTVFLARDTVTGEVVAVKKMKKTATRSGFPYYMLREVLFLFRLKHPNVVNGRTMAIDNRRDKGKEATFYIVMEFVATDMLSLVKFQASIPREKRIRLSQVKGVVYQLLHGLHNMHSQGLLHRDLKLANILLDNDGSLKIGDLGSIRDLGRNTLKLTTQIVTLWYRAPELLMGGSQYSYSIDIWSLGCLLVEMLSLKPLFPGTSELDTTVKIFRLLGRPSSQLWNGCYANLPLAPKVREYSSSFPHTPSLRRIVSFLSPSGHDFLNSCLCLDPSKRITTQAALDHPFWSEKPFPRPILLEKVGMISHFDERQLEMESEVMKESKEPLAVRNEKFKKFAQYAKKD